MAGGPDAGEVDFCAHDLLAGEMAAALGQNLIFDVEGGDIRPNVLVHGLGDRHRTLRQMVSEVDRKGRNLNAHRRSQYPCPR